MQAETRLNLLLSLLVVSLMLLSLTLGHAAINLIRLGDILRNPHGLPFIILTEIRLPRTVLAPLVGAALGISGAALQGLLRNPLAEPSVLGAPQMAAFGAACAVFLLGIETTSPVMAFYAIGFALFSVGVVALIGGRYAATSTLLIAGLALSSLASALLSLVLALSKNPFALAEIVFWLIGSLEDRSWRHVWLAAPPIIMGILLILPTRRALSALVLGEETARSLGLSLVITRWRIAVGVALAVGGAVAVTGAIGFVGLLAPHLVRAAVGEDAGRVLWPSALAGAALVLAADNLARMIPATSEIKVGMITALVGVPVFILILLRHRSRYSEGG